MKSLSAVGATLTIAWLFASPAHALMSEAAVIENAGGIHASEFGKTRPPIGYVKFCVSNPTECRPHEQKPARLAMDQDRWSTLYQVNTYVNGRIQPVSDQDLYGEPERWALPVEAGDCEDYLLLKKQYLEKLDFPPSALLITVVLDEHGDGHAILTIATDSGDYILDNRSNDILLWNTTKYKFLKRQSQQDPRQWVALAREKTFVASQMSASSK